MDTLGPRTGSNTVVCESLYTKLVHCNKLPHWPFISLNRTDRQTGISQLPNGLTSTSQCRVSFTVNAVIFAEQQGSQRESFASVMALK